ncbi:hypothetical protein PIB30_023620, partial [Stylosanthes scabra]|nr:hypothetical protein [Stylosanthes scabra]
MMFGVKMMICGKKLFTPFQDGRQGSIVLLTTRNANVGPKVQNRKSHFLNGLSNDYCWSIFATNASFPESNGCSELEEIGQMIVQRCGGLPLAAETLGRLLHSEHRVEEWKKILSSDIWELSITHTKIVPALLISSCTDSDIISNPWELGPGKLYLNYLHSIQSSSEELLCNFSFRSGLSVCWLVNSSENVNLTGSTSENY